MSHDEELMRRTAIVAVLSVNVPMRPINTTNPYVSRKSFKIGNLRTERQRNDCKDHGSCSRNPMVSSEAEQAGSQQGSAGSTLGDEFTTCCSNLIL